MYRGEITAPLRTAATENPTTVGVAVTAVTAVVSQARSDVTTGAPPSVNAFEAQLLSMTTARSAPTATELANGNVLLAGGFVFTPDSDAFTVLSSTDLYDAANNCFAAVSGTACAGDAPQAALSTARALATATLLIMARCWLPAALTIPVRR